MMNDPGPTSVERPARPAPPPWIAAGSATPGAPVEPMDTLRLRFEAALRAEADESTGDETGAASGPRTSLQDLVDLLAATLQSGAGPLHGLSLGEAGGAAPAARAAWAGQGWQIALGSDAARGAEGSGSDIVFITPSALAATGEAVALPALRPVALGVAPATPGPAESLGAAWVITSGPISAVVQDADLGTGSQGLGEGPDGAEPLSPDAIAAAGWADPLSLRIAAPSDGPASMSGAVSGPSEKVWQQVEAVAHRMTVAPSLAGGQQVRLDIDPRLLPGVQVVLQFSSGRLQVDFICSQEASRRRVRSVAHRELAGAAGRLGVDVMMTLRSEESDEADAECLHAAA